MRKIFFKWFFIFHALTSFSQDRERMNFIVMIDNEISGFNISEGFFIIKDSLDIEKEKLSFIHHVGYLELSKEAYQKIYSLEDKSKITIQFKNSVFNPSFKEMVYEYTFDSTWINKVYMLLKLYNFTKENRKIYWFEKNQDYVSEFSIPSRGTVIAKYK